MVEGRGYGKQSFKYILGPKFIREVFMCSTTE